MEKKLPSDHLEALLRTAKKMTPEQLAEQRRSFVYANLKMDGCDVTREMVDKIDEEMSKEDFDVPLDFGPITYPEGTVLVFVKREPLKYHYRIKDSAGEIFNRSGANYSTYFNAAYGQERKHELEIFNELQERINKLKLERPNIKTICINYESDTPGCLWGVKDVNGVKRYAVDFILVGLEENETVEFYEYIPKATAKYVKLEDGMAPIIQFSSSNSKFIAEEFNIHVTCDSMEHLAEKMAECYTMLQDHIDTRIKETKCRDVIVTYRAPNFGAIFTPHNFERGFYIHGIVSVTTDKDKER